MKELEYPFDNGFIMKKKRSLKRHLQRSPPLRRPLPLLRSLPLRRLLPLSPLRKKLRRLLPQNPTSLLLQIW